MSSVPSPKTKLSLFLTKAFAVCAPQQSQRWAHNLLSKPRGRRDYEFRTKQHPEEQRVPSYYGEVALFKFAATNKTQDSKTPTVFLSHGWADSTIRFKTVIDHLNSEGYNVWSLDHIGHGRSEGEHAHIFSYVEAVKVSLEFLEKRKESPDFQIGHSMGSLALLNQYKTRVKKSIFIAPPTLFFENLFKRTKKEGLSPYLVKRLIESTANDYGTPDWEAYSPAHQVHKLNERTLIIHDKEDEVCSLENIKELTKNTKAPFYITEGLGHLNILKDTTVLNKITDFFQS